MDFVNNVTKISKSTDNNFDDEDTRVVPRISNIRHEEPPAKKLTSSQINANIKAEKDNVRLGLKARMYSNQPFDVISLIWFNKWKEYVGFDLTETDTRTDEEREQAHPGPVDNSPLIGKFPEELTNTVIDGVDFILIPQSYSGILFTHYGGEPRFVRYAQNVGTEWMDNFQVKLFPMRFECYICNKTNPVPTGNPHVRYFKKFGTFDDIALEMRGDRVLVPYSHTCRLWYRLKSEASEDNDSNDMNVLDNHGRVLGKRSLTSDAVNIVDGWKLLLKLSTPVEECISDKGFVEIIVEVVEQSYMSSVVTYRDWPRYPLLRDLSSMLQCGDVIDASKNGVWYESVVQKVDENGATIHFRTLDDNCDEYISKELLASRISPLYSKTVDWKRSVEEDDMLDIRVPLSLLSDEIHKSNHNNVVIFEDRDYFQETTFWVQGVVEEVDSANQRILVSYNHAAVEFLGNYMDIDDSNTNYNNMNTANSTSMTSMAANTDSSSEEMKVMFGDDVSMIMTDDEKKSNRPSNIENKAFSGISKASMDRRSAAFNTFLKENEPKKVLRWFGFNSENVCTLHTHSIKTNLSSSFANGKKSNFDDYYYNRYNGNTRGQPAHSGAVGLRNIGNTCYMNSMLQCLSHTELLRDVFLSNRYRTQINRDNPVGYGGRVAKAYAQLMKDIWSNGYTVVSPTKFKEVMGQCWSQFQGYQQHDSQELMGCLLDGLHEDLNRITRKVSVPAFVTTGCDDDTISREAWRRHLLRHDSELLDIMYGQTKSLVTCRNCHNVSVKFEPYNCMILPIPVNRKKMIPVIVKTLNNLQKTYKIDVELDVEDNGYQIIRQVITAMKNYGAYPYDDGEDNEALGYVEGRYWQLMAFSASSYYNNTKRLSDNVAQFNANLDRLAVFEVEGRVAHGTIKAPLDTEYDLNLTSMDVFHVRSRNSTVNSWNTSNNFCDPLDFPTRLTYNKQTTTYQDMHQRIREIAGLYVRLPDDNESNENNAELPYQVYFGNCYGTIKYNTVPQSENTIFRHNSTESIVIVWNNELFDSNDFLDQFDKCEVHSSAPTTSGAIQLEHCLDRFVEREVLPEAETVYCSKCKTHLNPIKKIDIWTAPDVLIMQLKRFYYKQTTYTVIKQKVTDMVHYPVEGLDLTPYIKGPIDPEAPPIYDLYAISNHRGTLYSGHYTAVAKNIDNNEWWEYDDSSTYPTTVDSLQTPKAYVLFYKRRTGSLRWGGLSPLPAEQALPDEK